MDILEPLEGLTPASNLSTTEELLSKIQLSKPKAKKKKKQEKKKKS